MVIIMLKSLPKNEILLMYEGLEYSDSKLQSNNRPYHISQNKPWNIYSLLP